MSRRKKQYEDLFNLIEEALTSGDVDTLRVLIEQGKIEKRLC
jgi:hypothetical protein